MRLVSILVLVTVSSTSRVQGQFFYKELTPYVPLEVSKTCLRATSDSIICTVYHLKDINIEISCISENVLRIVGEYDTLRIICASEHALDFRYYGIQPTEAISVEWYKEVAPFTNSKMVSYGVDVRIRSVESLYQFYLKKFKNTGIKEPLVRHDYPRSGTFVFRGIYNRTIESKFFIYLEDSATPAFLRNLQTRITYNETSLKIPCVPSKFGIEVKLEIAKENLQGETIQFTDPIDVFHGLTLNVPSNDTSEYYGTYTCRMRTNNGNTTDILEMKFNRSLNASNVRFGLKTTLSKELGRRIKYSSKESENRSIQITIACKVDSLRSKNDTKPYLAAIEAENFAMMNLKREFPFPQYVNRSYTAQFFSTKQLTFEIRLLNTFKTRYGGATYCEAGDHLEVEEFAVPFVGDVSKRVFDTDWTQFQREASDIRIHFELGIHGETSSENENRKHYEGTNVTFECKFIVAIVVKPAIWHSIWKNGSIVEEKLDYNWTGSLEDTSYFTTMLHADMKAVACSASFYYAAFWRNISMPLDVKPGTKPKIENSGEGLVLRIGALNQGVTCTASGRPPPKLSLFKGGSQLYAFMTANGSLFHQIRKVESTHSGEYTCRAENLYGVDETVFHYVVERDEPNYGALIGIPVTVFLLTLVGAVVYIKIFKKEKMGLTKAEIEEFLAGEGNGVRSSSSYAHEFAHLTPYNKSFEIQETKFQIDTTDVLGSGAYGVVYKGIVEGRSVAVKTTKKDADKSYLKALLSELKIMIYLGYHENIVPLIGASTKDLDKGLVYLFVPFCGRGNLEKFLRTNRESYENANDIEYKNVRTEFNFNDLFNWAVQVADGMEYLSSRKVIHGDLAARNVLLTENKQARITDFGLSRQLYGYASYVKKNQEPLPWRWMALESLRDLSFSTLSDIWSYGVLLWEIFSLGEVPYPGMAWNLDFIQELENGLRMSRPKRAPEFIYTQILFHCWQKVPSQRPGFSEIRERLEEYNSIRFQKNPEQKYDNIKEDNEATLPASKGNSYTNV